MQVAAHPLFPHSSDFWTCQLRPLLGPAPKIQQDWLIETISHYQVISLHDAGEERIHWPAKVGQRDKITRNVRDGWISATINLARDFEDCLILLFGEYSVRLSPTDFTMPSRDMTKPAVHWLAQSAQEGPNSKWLHPSFKAVERILSLARAENEWWDVVTEARAVNIPYPWYKKTIPAASRWIQTALDHWHFSPRANSHDIGKIDLILSYKPVQGRELSPAVAFVLSPTPNDLVFKRGDAKGELLHIRFIIHDLNEE